MKKKRLLFVKNCIVEKCINLSLLINIINSLWQMGKITFSF